MADVASTKVRTVADKLRLKAQEALARGNQAAATSLHESVEDLRRAAALLLEQQQQLAQVAARSGGGAHAEAELVLKLDRVEKMLLKKSDEMKQKGNEGAAHALSQSAASVAQGCALITSLQQTQTELQAERDGVQTELQQLYALVMGTKVASDKVTSGDVMRELKEMLVMREKITAAFPDAGGWEERLERLSTSQTNGEARHDDSVEKLAAAAALEEKYHQVCAQLHEMKVKLDEEVLKAQEDTKSFRNQSVAVAETLGAVKAAHGHEVAKLQQELERSRSDHQLALEEKDLQLAQLEQRADSWKEQFDAQVSLVDELRRTLAEEEEQRALKFQHDALLAERSEAEAAAAKAHEERVLELEQEIARLQASEADLNNAAMDAQVQLGSAISRHQENVDELQSEINSLKDQVASLRANEKDAASSNGSDRVSELEEEVTAMRERFHELEVASKSKLQATEQELEAARVEVENTRIRVTELTTELDTLQQHVKEVEQQASVAAGHGQSLEATIEALEEKCAKANSVLDQEKQLAADRLNQIESLQAQICERNEQLNTSMDNDAHAQEDTLRSLKLELENVTQVLDDTKRAMNEQHEQFQTRESHLKKQLAEWENERGKQLEVKINLLEQSLEDAKAVVAEQERQIEDYVRQSSLKSCDKLATNAFEEKVESLQQQVDELTDQLHTEKSTSTEQEEKITTLESQLTEVSKELRDHSALLKSASERLQHVRDIFKESAEPSSLISQLKAFQPTTLPQSLDILVQELIEHLVREETLHQQQREFEEKLKIANEENEQLKENVKTLKSVKEAHARETIESQSKEVEAARSRVTEIEKEFERYRLRSHAALKKVEKRAELLNVMKKENEQLQAKMNEKDTLCSKAESEAQRLQTMHNEVTQAALMLNEEFHQKTLQFNETSARFMKEISQVKAEHDRLVAELEASKGNIATLVQEKEDLATAKNELHEQETRERDAKIDELQSEVDKLTTELRTAVEEHEELEKLVLKRRQENEKQLATVATLQEQLREMSKTEGVAEEMEKLRAKIHDVETENASIVNAQQELEAKLEVANKRVVELEKEVESLQSDKSAAMERVDQLTIEERTIQSEKSALQTEVEKLSSELATMRHLQEQTHAESAQLASNGVELAHAHSEIEKLTAQLATANAMIQKQSQQEVSQASDQLRILEEEKAAKEAQILRLLEEMEVMTKQKSASQVKIESLQEQIAVLQSQTATRAADPATHGPNETDFAKDELIKELRKQLLATTEELDSIRQQEEDRQQRQEEDELREVVLSTQKKRDRELKRKQVKAIVSSYTKKVDEIVHELQGLLETHSSAFKEACDVRDHQSANTENDTPVTEDAELNHTAGAEAEFEEYLVMNSGVVIKAGASFSLPVICDKPGWRVVWKFSVKEDGADVGFALLDPSDKPIVIPSRLNQLHGVYDVKHANTRLLFEWDNTFSWLNEKTLDYHVSIQEPLSAEKKELQERIRKLEAAKKKLAKDDVILAGEITLRKQLEGAMDKLRTCGQEKDDHLRTIAARKSEILAEKTALQQEMDAMKADLSAALTEQDEIEDDTKRITKAWETVVSELEDAETTLHLSGGFAELAEAMGKKIEEIDLELEEFEKKRQALEKGTSA
ncbi:TPA: hypothetical protein N0F65_006476 [Lagenidium giganteum]|uniref:GOLD domain-containing protein n=1 Tax=Lagenidium giganteum TaxID=4803 RepID=A0AAV2YR00_9STRA|nr:TPA: hypothetical protein N0F65_006476 [Lagenidium giganteum]